MSDFTFSYDAEWDLREIWDYIAADNEDAAMRVKNAVLDACDMLAANPSFGHFRRDLTSLPVRFHAVMRNYLVVYDPESSPLMIIRVLHAARDVASILK
jgi:plasmid stabilization system protein ParE